MTRSMRSFSALGLLVTLVGCEGSQSLDGATEAGGLGKQQEALSGGELSARDARDAVAAGVEARAVAPHGGRVSRKNPSHPAFLAANPGRAQILALPTPQDTLAAYAAKCEDATGIKIPAFSCENGQEVQQASGTLDLTGSAIGTNASGSRTVDTGTTIQRITARGADIWGNADSFYFAKINTVPVKPGDPPAAISGNGTIEVLVKSLVDTDQYAKAGLMIRASNLANAPNVSMVITPRKGAIWQRRVNNTSAPQTDTTELAGRKAPTWLRVTRSGNTFSGFVSPDRVVWTPVGSPVTISGIPSTALVGLAVSSHNTGADTIAVFDKLSWIPPNLWNPLQPGYCDRPNVLNGECDPGSRFQVLAQTGDATAVANCRKEGMGPGRWADIAVIQYNKKTGGICFFQALPYDRDLVSIPQITDGKGLGANAPAPATSSTGTNFRWYTTTETLDVGCPQCHDNGGFIRSPYLVQTGLLPNEQEGYDNYTPVSWVGQDFAQERSWAITTANYVDPSAPNDPELSDFGSECNTCHRLAVNNRAMGEGTAAFFAPTATAASGVGPGSYGQSQKHDHSVTSPIWMRPGEVEFYGPAYLTATEKWNWCSTQQWFGPGALKTQGWTQITSVSGCSYEPLGVPFTPPSFNDLQIGVTNGQRTQSGTQHTIVSKGTDIFGTSDQFFYALANAGEDGMLQVKVNSIFNSNAFAKAGLMFRSGIGASAAHVMVDITPTSGAQFQYRPTEGAQVTASTPLTPRTAPVWLRLYRSGNVYSGWVSNDNVTYNQVAAAVTLPSALNGGGMAVTSHNANQSTTAVFDRFSWIPAQHNLIDANIGLLSGFQTLNGANRVITVAGSDIAGNSDQFFYSFKQINSTFATVIAKVNGLGNTNQYAKAGLMIRSSIEPNARHVMVHLTPSSGAQFQARSTDGAQMPIPPIVAGWAPPSWLKLERAGNTFTGYASPDGETWAPIGSITISGFPATSLIGLAVTAHTSQTGAATTATFSNVYVP